MRSGITAGARFGQLRAGRPHPQGFRAAVRVPVDPPVRRRASGPAGSDFQNYTDPENDSLIPHTPSFGRPSLADLTRQLPDANAESRPGWKLSVARLGETWHGCDRSPFDGWENRAPADDLSPSDPPD